MTITGSGNPLSLNDLNIEFGNAGSDQLSLSQSFAGTFAQYGAINRNTTAGQTVYSVYTAGTDFALNTFYSYNDLENNYWDYLFDMNAFDGTYDVNLDVALGSSNYIYINTVVGGTKDESAGYVDTTFTGGSGGADLLLRIRTQSNMPPYVDITVTDPDTSTALVSLTNEDPLNYSPAVPLCTIYGYQRFQMTLYFHG
jgi:hypothetical protein